MAKPVVVYKGSGGGHTLKVVSMTFDADGRTVTRWEATGSGWSKGSLWTERTAEESLLAMVKEVRSWHPRAAIRIVPEPGSGALIPVGLDIVESAGPRQCGNQAPALGFGEERPGVRMAVGE